MRAGWLASCAVASALQLGCGSGGAASPTPESVPDSGAARTEAGSKADGGEADATLPREDAAGADAADASLPTCGIRTGKRGLTRRSVTVVGQKRTYLVYLPQASNPTTAVPFVYVFHGYTMSGLGMHDITQYAALADQEGFGLAFPDGEAGPDSLGAPWNVENAGQTVCGGVSLAVATGDDFGFMDAMKADVLEDQCLDARHVFATGFSMGGYFAEHIACYRSDIRAVGPHSSGTLADLSPCTTGHVPMILFHGTADGIVPAGCDDPLGIPQAGFPPSAALWATRNGCKSTYSTIPEVGGGGSNGRCVVYDGCPADGQVELCTFDAMGHCWAGGSANGADSANACPTYANATALEWAFFKKYAW